MSGIDPATEHWHQERSDEIVRELANVTDAEIARLTVENERLNETISKQWEIINAQKKRPGQRTLIERARNARHENKWLHRRLARAEADLAKYRAVQEAVKSALLMGGQTADIRCRAALAALVNPERD